MRRILPKSIFNLAQSASAPIYAVGGVVRDFLLGNTASNSNLDFDICAPILADELISLAIPHGFTVKSVFKNTQTVKLQDAEGNNFEFSSFRSDKYIRGVHTPVETVFTTDILLDAKRRDFTANAVYYHLQAEEFVDPLQGKLAILEKRLSTVDNANKVFGEDGLRLLRLARFAGQLGFSPDEECLLGAKNNAHLIKDIAPERVFAELNAMLCADLRFGVKDGHYRALCVLDKTRVLDYLLPELTLGRGMKQRPDFHKHDVLEHSLRAVLYASPSVRLSALLHDIAKPFCKLRDGNSYAHPQEGARIAKEVLQRWKAPKKTVEEVSSLVETHMYDFNCQTKETKLKKFFVENQKLLPSLLLLKQADFSACTDDLSPAPTCVRWQNLLQKMKEEGAPLSLRELAVSGKDLLALNIPQKEISTVLSRLLLHAACNPKDNKIERLLLLATRICP